MIAYKFEDDFDSVCETKTLKEEEEEEGRTNANLGVVPTKMEKLQYIRKSDQRGPPSSLRCLLLLLSLLRSDVSSALRQYSCLISCNTTHA